ncbi:MULTISPECIES: hypothetical protein [Curtobacterium]|uniref:hypothetical protein n=1 Tax=Curtobacterium flaccumfaciens TaxID=2035 RepID=UPI003EE62E76
MSETIAHAALLSDRRSARGQYEALLLADGRLVAQITDGTIPLTGKVVAARVLDRMEVPRKILPKPGNGAIAIRDDLGKSYVIPIDPWWMAPPVPTTLEVALRSSGLSALVDQYRTGSPVEMIDQHTKVIRPLPKSAASRSERAMRLLLLASGALLPVSVMVALLVAAFAHVLPEALWTLPQITTSLATVAATASVVQGRKRVRTAAFTFDVEVKPSGPRWFAENASLAVDDRGLLVITDGQGLWHRLETARSTSGPKAISTVIFSDQNGGAALLIDGTGTVRLQLSAALWYPDGAEGLRNVFHAIGILTKIGSDQRDSPDVALGLLTHVEEPKRSLAEQNDLCVARVTPLAGGVLFPCIAASVPAGAGYEWAAALCLLAALVNVAAIARISWVESSVRIGVGRIRPIRPQDFRLGGRALLLAVLAVVCLLVAVIAGRATRWDLVAISAAILFAAPTVMWASYRRRSLISGSGYLRLPSWWASGAPPVEGTAT